MQSNRVQLIATVRFLQCSLDFLTCMIDIEYEIEVFNLNLD